MKIMFRDWYNCEEEYRPIELDELKKILAQCDAQNEYCEWGYFTIEIDKVEHMHVVPVLLKEIAGVGKYLSLRVPWPIPEAVQTLSCARATASLCLNTTVR